MFAVGALLTAALAVLGRAALVAVLEPRGGWLDRCRRRWFHPERELGSLLEAFLILAFVANFVARFSFPRWTLAVVAAVWALHLPADGWSWFRVGLHPHATRPLHLRGFLLLDLGPLWLRSIVVGVAAGLYFLVPPLRWLCDSMMRFILISLLRWVS